MQTSPSATTILVAHHDSLTLQRVADNLDADGYNVHVASSRYKAADKVGATRFDIILVGLNGFTVEFVDEFAERVPTIALLDTGDRGAITRVLNRGADDALGGDFHYTELVARMNAVLRRRDRAKNKPTIEVDGVELHTGARTVRAGDVPVEVSQKEYQLLLTLMREPTRVFTKDDLVREIWGCRSLGTSRTLDSHACRLRVKLRDACGAELINNVWGVGYRFHDPALTAVA